MRSLRNLGLLIALSSTLCFAQSETAAAPPSQPHTIAQPAQPQLPVSISPRLPESKSSDARAEVLAAALALYRAGNLNGSAEKYQQIIQENPSSPEAYAGLTRVYLKRKDVEAAFQTATKGVGIKSSPELQVALGEVYFRQGKISAAEQEWANVINGGHPDARAYAGIARVREAMARFRQAKDMLDKAHALDPDDPDVQKYWIETLTRDERIKYLELYLSAPNNEDSEERGDTQRYVDFMKERAKQGGQSCHLVSTLTSTETPMYRLLLDAGHHRGYGLTVTVNDHKTHLLLDTGASGILLDRGAAEKAGIVKLTNTLVGGIGDKGRKNGYVGLAKSVKVGALEFQNCPVEVLDSRSVVGEEGLIGADVFSDFLVDLDFPKEMLRLVDLPKRPGDPARPVGLHSEEDNDATPDTAGAPAADPKARFHDGFVAPEMKTYTRIFRFGHILLIPTMVGGAQSKLFLIDTGAFKNEISPAAAREVTKIHADDNMVVTGISGRVKKVYSADKAVLQFGHLRQENQDLMSFDLTSLSNNVGTEVSGILGFGMLHLLDMKIDYRDGLVDLNYKSGPWD